METISADVWMGRVGADARALHYEHPRHSQNRCLVEHLEIVRCARAGLRRERGVLVTLVRNVVLIAFDRGDCPLRLHELARTLGGREKSAHVM